MEADGFREQQAVYAELPVTYPVAIAQDPLDAAGPETASTHADAFRPADLEHCGLPIEPDRFYEPSYRRSLSALVTHVVACEAPIYEDVLVRRISRAHGLGRAGRTVRETILSLVDPSCARSEEDGQSVIWRAGDKPIQAVAFRRAAVGVRAHTEIPLAELAGLARMVQSRRSGGDLVKVMAAELGLSRLEGATRLRFERAVDLATSAKRASIGAESIVADGTPT